MEGKTKKIISGVAIGLAAILIGGVVGLLGRSLGWFGKTKAESEPTPELLNFEETAYGTYAVSLKDYTAKKVVIPASYNGKAVTEISGCAALPSIMERYNASLYSNTDTQIKDTLEYVFMGEEVRQEVNDFGATLGHIGFGAATNLLWLEIPESVKIIHAYAFYGCCSLIEIKIPKGVTALETGTFQYNSALTKVDLPESVNKIGENVFLRCSNLKKLNLPVLETLPSGLFWKVSLEEMVIPEGVKYIAANAFNECKTLAKIVLPSTLEKIEDKAFQNCPELKTVYNLSKLEIVAGAETFGGVAKNATNVYTELPGERKE